MRSNPISSRREQVNEEMTIQDRINKRNLIESLERSIGHSLTSKIPETELSSARLSTEWQERSDSSFKLEDCPMLKDCTALIAFEAVKVQVQTAHGQLLLLLARIAKRNLNEVRADPPPATFASHCMGHLLNCSVIVGKKAADFEKAWQALAEGAYAPLNLLIQKPVIHLADLESSLFDPQSTEEFSSLCQDLTNDFQLLTQITEIVTNTYDKYLSQVGQYGQPNQWISLDHSLAAFKSARKGQRVLEEFKAFSAMFLTFSDHRIDLICGQFGDYLLQLLEVSQGLCAFIERLEVYDAEIFAGQNLQNHESKDSTKESRQALALKVENRLVIVAIAQRLRMSGESMDDIETFSRNLLEYTSTHRTPCLGMLEEELAQLAPRIAPHVLTKTLNHVRINDLNFPLSIKHKARISQSIERSERVAKTSLNSALGNALGWPHGRDDITERKP